MIHGLTQLTYLAAAALFILSLRWLSHPKTARRGVAAGVGGMALAIVGTLLAPEIVNFKWIAIAALVGIVIGVPAVVGAADRGAAADGAVACVRRPRRRPRRHRQVHDLVPARRADARFAWGRSRSRSSSAT